MLTVTRTGSVGGFLLLGVILTLCGALMTFNSMQEVRYQPVPGVIKKSEVKKIQKTRAGSQVSSIGWYLLVEYEYTLTGKTYTSDNIASENIVSDASGDKPPSEKILKLVESFQPGNIVTVYISPTAPERSILLRTPIYGVWPLMAGVITLLGVCYFYFIK